MQIHPPDTAGPPTSLAGSSKRAPEVLVPALGLSAWFCAASSTIWAERLRWVGLQAAPSSFHRQLFSCSSSLDLLRIGSVSLAGEQS